MKNLDVISDPSAKVRKHTLLGGVLTIVLLLVGCLLFFKEIAAFKNVEISKNMFLDMDEDSEAVLVNFSINLFSAPCVLVALDVHDNLNHHMGDVPLRKQKLDPRTGLLSDFVKLDNDTAKIADVVKDLEEGVGCALSGTFELSKVSGNFHISFHSEMNLYWRLASLHPSVFDKINLSYELKTLYFGRKENEFEMENIRRLVNDLDLSDQLLQNFVDFKPQKFDHFLATFWMEIIPYTLVDNRQNYSYRSYQNSFNMKTKLLMGQERISEVPVLEFNYKFSALSAQYSITAGSYKHIAVTILILLGGVFVFLGLINSALLTLFNVKLND